MGKRERKKQAARAAQRTTAPIETLFGPGESPAGVAGLSGRYGMPRQWPYGAGYNLAQRPRGTEATSFEQLRNLAALYDGVQLCERVYFELLSRLELRVVPRTEAVADGFDGASRAWRATAQAIAAFLESPDRTQDLRSWLTAFTRDLLEIDAVAVYSRVTRGGALYALELVAGETIKPLIDESGRAPQPPEPAYQQFLYGMPAGAYALDELEYLRETARTDSVYGLSRVERILLRVNQALRKQNFDLARFTDGVTPLGLIEPPPEPQLDARRSGDLRAALQRTIGGQRRATHTRQGAATRRDMALSRRR